MIASPAIQAAAIAGDDVTTDATQDSATVHVVGAGLAGLAAAIALVSRGRAVALYDAAPQAGGRCRSLYEPTLKRRIDNGNHLILGGNARCMAYLDTIGARDRLAGAARPAFPFLDLASGARWTLRPGRGPLPLWLLDPRRRAPGTRPRDYLATLRRLARAETTATVAEVLGGVEPLFTRFWEPLAVAVLNTAAEEGAAALLRPVITRVFGGGAKAAQAFVAREGLSECFIDPALAWLAARGCAPRLGARLRAIERGDGRVRRLDFGDGESLALAPHDAVILAVPPANLARLLPEVVVPRESRAIVNAHFRLGRPPAELPEGAPFMGLIGGAAQWLFLRDDVASVTVSAADALADRPADEIAARLWRDVARALALDAAPPPYRIVKERRATFAQTPAEVARRASARTEIDNLFLAGDWTDTGLPATIEGAIVSGETAAELALGGQGAVSLD